MHMYRKYIKFFIQPIFYLILITCDDLTKSPIYLIKKSKKQKKNYVGLNIQKVENVLLKVTLYLFQFVLEIK